ncbi:hypothetical protein LCGC14_1056040 [marine sediment metagenome]|uniref:Uncharacterized protein n=1 Tax=marine sediment metagenome TaxID=412755 RepID=A0A0F9Q5I5_9ZZZZ
MQPVEPTEGLPGIRVEFAKEQLGYNTLVAMYEADNQGRVTSCWSLDARERKAIMEEANIKLTLLTFSGPPQPVVLVVEGVRPVAEREAV